MMQNKAEVSSLGTSETSTNCGNQKDSTFTTNHMDCFSNLKFPSFYNINSLGKYKRCFKSMLRLVIQLSFPSPALAKHKSPGRSYSFVTLELHRGQNISEREKPLGTLALNSYRTREPSNTAEFISHHLESSSRCCPW